MTTDENSSSQEENNMKLNDVNDYRQVIHDNLKIIHMDGLHRGDGYLGMSLENLETNILNMLTDCNDDAKAFRRAVSQVFGRPYDNPTLEDESKVQHD